MPADVPGVGEGRSVLFIGIRIQSPIVILSYSLDVAPINLLNGYGDSDVNDGGCVNDSNSAAVEDIYGKNSK